MSESYDDKLKVGQAYERFVRDQYAALGITLTLVHGRTRQLLIGDTEEGLEIKHDRNHKTTSNIFIEVAEKRHSWQPDFVPSGIFRQDKTWLYGVGNYDVFYVFKKATLREESTRRHIFTINEGTSRGFLLVGDEALQWSSRVRRWGHDDPPQSASRPSPRTPESCALCSQLTPCFIHDRDAWQQKWASAGRRAP